jgi:hypothetical protein
MKRDRKKCLNCGVYVCGICSIPINKKNYCVNCGLEKSIKMGLENLDLGEQKIIIKKVSETK